MTKEELEKEAEEKCVCTDEAMRIMYGIGYIDGAEPREKRIADLEKENENLKKTYRKQRNKRIDELQKENAELKKQLVEKGQHLDLTEKEWGKDLVQMYHFKTLYNKQSEQLTKAKEIIREFVEWATWQGRNCPSFKSIQDKAEQFLKDSEVEK